MWSSSHVPDFFLAFCSHPLSSPCFGFTHQSVQLQPVTPQVPAAATGSAPSLHNLPQVSAHVALRGNHHSLDCKELCRSSFPSRQPVHPHSLGGLRWKWKMWAMAVTSLMLLTQLNAINTENTSIKHLKGNLRKNKHETNNKVQFHYSQERCGGTLLTIFSNLANCCIRGGSNLIITTFEFETQTSLQEFPPCPGPAFHIIVSYPVGLWATGPNPLSSATGWPRVYLQATDCTDACRRGQAHVPSGSEQCTSLIRCWTCFIAYI